MIDAVAGSGTAIDTIFELKKQGVFRGAKRKLNFVGGEGIIQTSLKCAKLEEVNGLLDSLKISPKTNKTRADVRIKLSDTRAGWHGFKRTSPNEKKINRNVAKTPEKYQNSIPGAMKTPSSGKLKKCGKNKLTPSQGQSLMLDFISCTPKSKETVGCSIKGGRRSPK